LSPFVIKFFRLPRGLSATLEEEYFHHEGREAHEDRKGIEPGKNIFFLRGLRVLRGSIHFSLGCGSIAMDLL
jgi:hypothetical protein